MKTETTQGIPVVPPMSELAPELVGMALLIRGRKRGTGRRNLRDLQPDRVVLALRRKMESENSK